MTGSRTPSLLAIGLVAASALAGCGSSSKSSTTASTPATTTATTPAAGATTAATSTPAATEAASGNGKITPLGTTLKMGETATIAYEDSSNHKKSTIELTPKKIEKGSLDDFKNIDLDADQKTATPYYAQFTVKNVGKGDLSGAEPAGFIDGVDDRGQDQSEIIFFGKFDRCNHETPKKFKPGDSYDTCLAYLIPKGGTLKGMHWIAYDEKTQKSDYVWK